VKNVFSFVASNSPVFGTTKQFYKKLDMRWWCWLYGLKIPKWWYNEVLFQNRPVYNRSRS